MAHEEGQIHQQISGRDKSGLCYAATAIQTQDQSRPHACEHQQNELHVPEIMPDDAKVEVRRHGIGGSVSGGERAAGIDRISEQGRRHPRQECCSEQDALNDCRGFTGY